MAAESERPVPSYDETTAAVAGPVRWQSLGCTEFSFGEFDFIKMSKYV